MMIASLLVMTQCNPSGTTGGMGSGGGAGSGSGGVSGTGGSTPPVATINPTPGDIAIPVEDTCSTITDTVQASACRTFMANEIQYVLPGLEDISGLRFRDCMDRIRFEFNTDTSNLGQAYQDGRVGIIQFNRTLTPQYFTASPPLVFDDHEPVHLLLRCAHVPQTYNNNHVFFFGLQAELDARIYERSGHALTLASTLAANNRQYISDHFEALTRDPSLFGRPGQFFGCPGGISYILFADYLRPHHEIVHDWLMAVYNDPALAALPYVSTDADQRFLQVMVNLMTPTSGMRSFLSPYCPLP